MGTPLDDTALDVIFRAARTQNKWRDEPVSDEQLQALYDLVALGADKRQLPLLLRIVFVKSPAAKERLKALVLAGNQPKVAAAPVTAILGYDTQFYEWPRGCSRTPTPGPGSSTSRTSRRPRPSATACKGRTSSSRRGRSGSTPGRCPASTTRRSTGSSSPAGG